MGKKINIQAEYLNARQIFNCTQQEFLETAAEHFNINMENFELLCQLNKNGDIRKIKALEITDMMKIKIVPKEALQNGQRSLRSYFAKESTSNNNIITNNIITKLRNNTPLTGPERKQMVEWLEGNDLSPAKKRKISDVNSKVETRNKKIQVNLPLTHSSFTQTDSVQIGDITEAPDEEPLSLKIKKLVNSKTVDMSEIKKLMQASFDERRNFILLKSPLIQLVRDKYPLLFSTEEVKNELDRIFYPGKCVSFINNMVTYSKHILDMCSPSDDLYIMTQKNIASSKTEIQKTYARVVGSIFVLAKFLEEGNQFIHFMDTPRGSKSSVDVYPHIDASSCSLKEIFFDNFLFKIVAEGQTLCEAPNFQEAILCLVACFFIFNIDYPVHNQRTLTVFEKLFLTANDTTDVDEITHQLIKMLQLKALGQRQ